ncbi:MAG: holo-ACP synthase [Sedimentibacter sp.]|uniref:holo-ACP synthase n=1 Tax=Sedimentibacter sp. TaxID=1960295 RepID=UPI0029826812|nr:holo-ACP synthase [Sedimentibacter sp.]MDW5298897.1 holo-ACP synthase [Sedimentibacter sp.]
MVLGVGTDIVEIQIFKEVFLKNQRFRDKVFTEKEIHYCENELFKYQHYAARFAAKEAYMKAIGTGWDKGISWKQIEILNICNGESKKEEIMFMGEKLINKKGQPKIVLNGTAFEISKKIGAKNHMLSLTHTDTMAIAFVIIEG